MQVGYRFISLRNVAPSCSLVGEQLKRTPLKEATILFFLRRLFRIVGEVSLSKLASKPKFQLYFPFIFQYKEVIATRCNIPQVDFGALRKNYVNVRESILEGNLQSAKRDLIAMAIPRIVSSFIT